MLTDGRLFAILWTGLVLTVLVVSVAELLLRFYAAHLRRQLRQETLRRALRYWRDGLPAPEEPRMVRRTSIWDGPGRSQK